MRLYLSRTSPYARKVHAALIEKAIPFELEYLLPSDSALIERNPLAKVPALLRDDNTALFDSPVILQYLEAVAPRPQLFPSDPLARIEVLQLEALCDGICDATVLRMMEGRRPPEKQEPAAKTHQEKKVESGLIEVEKRLGKKQFVFADTFSAADIALACTVGYLHFRAPELITSHALLNSWYEKALSRPSLQSTQPVNPS